MSSSGVGPHSVALPMQLLDDRPHDHAKGRKVEVHASVGGLDPFVKTLVGSSGGSFERCRQSFRQWTWKTARKWLRKASREESSTNTTQISVRFRTSILAYIPFSPLIFFSGERRRTCPALCRVSRPNVFRTIGRRPRTRVLALSKCKKARTGTLCSMSRRLGSVSLTWKRPRCRSLKSGLANCYRPSLSCIPLPECRSARWRSRSSPRGPER